MTYFLETKIECPDIYKKLKDKNKFVIKDAQERYDNRTILPELKNTDKIRV